MHLPEMERHRSGRLYVIRIYEALGVLGIRASELLAWSLTLRAAFNPPAEDKEQTATAAPSSVLNALEKLSQQMDELILRQTRVEERLAALETNSGSITKQAHISTQRHCKEPTQGQPKRARKRALKALTTVWFEWFTAVPRMYESTSVSKATLHESRHAVAYMMLCVSSKFKLDLSSTGYKAEVHAVGVEAEKPALEFLVAQGSQAAAIGSVFKAMRALHKAGQLDSLVAQFREIYFEGDIIDPTPHSALRSFMRFT
ncbi:hypothetical protein PR001_g7129 [Phytophthora rubi]|uniref:Uncharacterized protein n=1 Tax=Phytophthora rubi TaxID=129364 RepID=A0A6A3N9Q0_9STRA|nr:hypothetical protein PR001_g7129 [Phytophthora rubi]